MIWAILLYILYLIIFGIFSYFAFFYLNKFCYKGDASRMMMIGYIVIAIGIVVVSFIILSLVAGFSGG